MLLREIEEYSKQQESLLPRHNPEVLIFDTPETVDTFAALRVIEQVRTKPDSILTLPTGNTPIAMHQHIVESHKQGRVDFSRVTIFNLDEYCPIQQTHPSSYTAFMRRCLIDHVPVLARHIPNGEAPGLEAETERYRYLLEQHQPIDLAILGIGPSTTCHIGFNERGSAIDSVVRYVSLHPETKQENAKAFANPEEIPKGALTRELQIY
ncbi:MAG: 6-phosphogluconolactonase [Candidatus Levybacteria bacterium]|nr:6-phosphogluconolactonase [Candidatus Levybacteria bacterium]